MVYLGDSLMKATRHGLGSRVLSPRRVRTGSSTATSTTCCAESPTGLTRTWLRKRHIPTVR